MTSTSRIRMIEATETLMREQGLAGAGIKQVVARSDAPIGSVYHHFPGGKTQLAAEALRVHGERADRKSTRLNSSHVRISYAVFCLKKKKKKNTENFFKKKKKKNKKI